MGRLQHPEGVHPSSRPPSPRWHADLRQDLDWQDHHFGGRAVRQLRKCQGKDPRQGRNPSRPAAFDLRGQAVGGRSHFVRLQHSKGVDPSSRLAPPWRTVKPNATKGLSLLIRTNFIEKKMGYRVLSEFLSFYF